MTTKETVDTIHLNCIIDIDAALKSDHDAATKLDVIRNRLGWHTLEYNEAINKLGSERNGHL